MTGSAPPSTPTFLNEIAWGPPGSSVPLFSGGPGANANGALGPAARIPVGSVIQTNCRTYNLAVATSNSGGWWYRIATGTYTGYWTPASVYENGSGPSPATGASGSGRPRLLSNGTRTPLVTALEISPTSEAGQSRFTYGRAQRRVM